MVTLAIDLQDGFAADSVVVRIDGKEVFSKPSVTSNAMTGYADHFEQEVKKGPATINVSVGTRNLQGTFPINVTGDTYLGIYIDANSVNFRLGDFPFGYM